MASLIRKFNLKNVFFVLILFGTFHYFWNYSKNISKNELALSKEAKQLAFPKETTQFALSKETTQFALSKEIKKYLEEDGCQITHLEPWDDNLKKILKPTNRYNDCKKHSPLTSISNKKLLIDQKINVTHYSGKIEHCEFAPVVRETSKSDSYNLGGFQNFTSGMETIDQVIVVRCYIAGKIEYEYVHHTIHRKQVNTEKKRSDERLNVVIIVIDSLSNAHAKRALPKTLDFLKSQENFFQFENMHSVGPSTIYNVVPLLSGLHKNILQPTSNPHNPPYDDFPFIWKNFTNNEYVTFFDEDWKAATFVDFGFKKQPTDYYYHHYWLSLYNSKSAAFNPQNSNLKPCYFDKLFHLLSLDTLRRFLNEYSPIEETDNLVNQNYFTMTWINEMSHDYMERVFWIDEDIHGFFKEIITPTFLDNTLLILASDHGQRYHAMSNTPRGNLEWYLPYFGMIVPHKLMKKNQFLKETLKKNADNLVTHYDIYETLLHLLLDQTNMDTSNSEYLKNRSYRTKSIGKSLFTQISKRDCKEAGIPRESCKCRS